MQTAEQLRARWRKSSRSGTNGACVEVGASRGGEHVLIRDTRNRVGAVLDFTPAEWNAFLTGVRNGQFDRTALAM